MKYRITGIMLVAVPIAFNLVFFALSGAFEYPDILREPTAYILVRFEEGGSGLVALWYAFALTVLMVIPLAILLKSIFADEYPQLAEAAMIFGVLSGLVQAMGLFRWVFLVPSLAQTYTDVTADPATHESAAIVFEASHRYLGVAIGEHLGYLFTGLWMILLSIMMFRSQLFHRWLGGLGIISALGIMVGLLEPAGWGAANMITALGYILLSIWLILIGIVLLVASTPRKQRIQTQAFANL